MAFHEVTGLVILAIGILNTSSHIQLEEYTVSNGSRDYNVRRCGTSTNELLL